MSKQSSPSEAIQTIISSNYYQPNVLQNKQKLQNLQDTMSLSLGVGAGVLGLESLHGFAFFLVGITLSNFTFFRFACEGEPQTFFKSPLKEIFVDGLFTCLSGFIMMWCLTYALVK